MCLRFFVAGEFVRFIISMAIFAVALVGCSSSASPASPTATATSVRTGASGTPPAPRLTPTPRPVSVVVDGGFATAVRSLCAALARKDSSTVTRALPYYQYNSGLRYGMLGDGEGQTGDPGLMATWLAHSSVHCVLQSSGGSRSRHRSCHRLA